MITRMLVICIVSLFRSQILTPLQHAISLLQKRMCSLSPVSIEVRRNCLLADALKEAGKKKFDVTKKIKVSQTVESHR